MREYKQFFNTLQLSRLNKFKYNNISHLKQDIPTPRKQRKHLISITNLLKYFLGTNLSILWYKSVKVSAAPVALPLSKQIFFVESN